MAQFQCGDKVRISPDKAALRRIKDSYEILATYSGTLVSKEPTSAGKVQWFVQIKGIKLPVLIPEELLVLASVFETVQNVQSDFDTSYRKKQKEIWNRKMDNED